MAAARGDGAPIVLGRIVGLFGVQGWVKVYSFARPREGILDYERWLIETDEGWLPRVLHEGRLQGKGIVARLEGCRDREQASALIGTKIAVSPDDLPALAQGEYYWAQLEGLAVVTADGRALGVVSHLFETGANDVMVVDTATPGGRRTPSRLIPYVQGVVRKVDLESGVILVDWDPHF
jgi:16S rRNA processing protein RimM